MKTMTTNGKKNLMQIALILFLFFFAATGLVYHINPHSWAVHFFLATAFFLAGIGFGIRTAL